MHPRKSQHINSSIYRKLCNCRLNQRMKGFFALIVFITATCQIVRSCSSHHQPQPFTCTATCPACPAENDKPTQRQPVSNDPSDKVIEQLVNANTRAIDQLKDTLSDLKNMSYTTSGIVNNIREMLNTSTPLLAATPLLSSCKDIKQRMPSSPSGVYLIAAAEGKTQYVYCQMESLCNSDEGWTRLAHIDMTDLSNNCPGGLRLYEANGKRACGRPVSSIGSCHSIKYPSNGVKYSKVCGRAIGYQYYTTDAVDSTIGTAHHNDINSFYVDGVSLTRGSPRQHIWTFMSGLKEDNSWPSHGTRYTCPCQTGSEQKNKIPSFIEDSNYYCESGNPIDSQPPFPPILYTADPLWDGKNCGGLETDCCAPVDLPWFYKPLSTNTSDYIEVRVCSDQGTGNEDTTIEQLEIYVN